MTEPKENNLRINAIVKDDQSLKISIVTNSRTTVAKLKRLIELEFNELYNINILVSTVQDLDGFIFSNNSAIGEHVKQNETLYIQTHKDKYGSNMNLPNNIADLFMTLRYVCSSVIKKIENLNLELNAEEIVPEIIHMGFWYSNAEAVTILCKLLNKIFNPTSLERFYNNAHEMQNNLLLKLFSFWFSEVQNSFNLYPEVAEELLALLYKMSLSPSYVNLLKNHKIMKNIIEISKDSLISAELKRMALQIVKNISGKSSLSANLTSKSGYIPTTLAESNYEFSNIEEILQSLVSNRQQAKKQALQSLAQNPKIINEICVRFDYYLKLTHIFTMKSIKDKTSIRLFNQVVKQMTQYTSTQKAKDVIQKDILRKIHNFLLESHVDAHEAVFQYFAKISSESASKGIYNIEQANEFILSPYPNFQKYNIQALALMSQKDKQVSAICFLPYIKDYIKLSLKTQNENVSTNLLKIICNLTLDEQCRYQIINLKGIQLLVKFLQIGDKNKNQDLQRTCAKGLLNLSISSREIKAKALSLLSNVLDRYYKGFIDTIAGGYIENMLKSSKN